MDERAETGGGFAVEHARAEEVDRVPVSYTHLDVYKRQYEGRQEVNARLDDLRHGLEERRNEALYQRGERLEQYRDSLDNARREPCNEL